MFGTTVKGQRNLKDIIQWFIIRSLLRGPSLKEFNKPTKSWEQIAQDLVKWQGLIRRGTDEYEAKRNSEAEQKHAQQKARAKASPTEP